jgi:acyl-homoserine-lactone acylase
VPNEEPHPIMSFRFPLLLAFVFSFGLFASSPARAGQVTIFRDSYGVPSIVAKTMPDAAYGLGYAMAQDDLVVMERNFLRARGHLAEVDGISQLYGDGAIQALGLEQRAADSSKNLSGEQGAILNSFCAGVNRSMAEQASQKGGIPNLIKPCTPTDLLAFAEFINCVFPLYYSNVYQSPLGSNEFAIAPKRSADGHAIVSLNPHLPWQAPFLWYEFAIYTGDGSFRGVTLAGLPMGIMGHTNHVAWAMTNNNPQTMVAYTLKTDAAHPGQYLHYGSWLKFTSLTLPLRYLKGADLAVMSIALQMTVWGPVFPGQTVAFHLECPDPRTTFEQSLAMMRARNAKQFRDALRQGGESMWNFVYADTDGNIGYQYNAYLAKRDPSFNWSAPVPGDDPKTALGPPLTLDDLPHIDNPTSGLLVNCNTPPWLTPVDKEMPAAWPAYITSYPDDTRYDRLSDLLTRDNAMTVETAEHDAADTQVPNAKATVAAISKAEADTTSAANQPGAPTLAVLTAWNGRADTDSVGCALFWYWLKADPACPGLAWSAGAAKAWTSSDESTALAALGKAAQSMTKDHGRLDLPWGAVHVIDRGSTTAPVHGFDTAGLTAVDPNDGPVQGGVIHCDHGSSFRMIVDLDPSGVKSWSILPFGESQNPNNPHYADQMEMFGKGQYKETFFGIDGVKEHAVSTTTLTAP